MVGNGEIYGIWPTDGKMCFGDFSFEDWESPKDQSYIKGVEP
jgi:hypothetical protein